MSFLVSADNSVALAIAFCSFLITVLLIYGAITVSVTRFLKFQFIVHKIKLCLSTFPNSPQWSLNVSRCVINV